MKKIFFSLLIASTTLFFSCGKDNDNNNNENNGGGGGSSYNAPSRHLSKATYWDGYIDSYGDTVYCEYRFSWDGDHMTKIDVYHKSSFERLDLTFNIEWDGDKVIKTTMNSPNMSPGNVTTFTYNGDQLVKSHSTYYGDDGEIESEVLYEYTNGKISQITYPDEYFPYPIEVTWDRTNIATLSMLDRTMLEYTFDSKKNPLYLPMGVMNNCIIEGTFGEGVNNTIGYLFSLSSMTSGNPLSLLVSSWSENNIVKITNYDGSEIPIEYIYDGDYPISISRTFVYADEDKHTETHTIEFYYDD